MKVLAISDFDWNKDSKSIRLSDTLKMTSDDILNNPRFSKVKFYFEIVKKASPDILLLCGDITGDGSCGHGHVSSIIAFLRLIELERIITRFISGNHDEPQYYDEVKKLFSDSKYIKELSYKPETIGDLKLVGLSYIQTNTKTSFKEVFTNEKVDIVVCHCTLSQRLNLFDFNTDFIITGHYDLKVINANNKTFISLDNDAPEGTNYALLDIDSMKKEITFYLYKEEWIYFKFHKTVESFLLKDTNYSPSKFSSFDTISFLSNSHFKEVIETVLNKKKYGQKINSTELAEMLEVSINPSQKVSRKFLKSYIAIE